MKYLLSCLLLILIACHKDTPPKYSNPFQDISEINQVRDSIVLKWEEWLPEINEKHTIIKNSGEIQDKTNDLICHYLYPEIQYEYTLTGIENDSPIYLVNRILNNYTIGQQTTHDITFCNEHSNKKLTSLDVASSYLLAFALLNLDRLPNPQDNPITSELGDIPLRAYPIKITSSSKEINNATIGIYTLTYYVDGYLDEKFNKLLEILRLSKIQNKIGQNFYGFLSITFATEVVPGALILSTEAKLVFTDKTILSETRQEVTNLNGVKF